MNKLKIIFLGTPNIACKFLNTLRQSELCELCAVISSPDRPAGRGLKIKASPISLLANSLNLPLFKPKKKSEIKECILPFKPDLAITCAYSKLIPESTLLIPKQGFINIHFSLLPKYRGAAPVQRALMSGEKESGVTIFWLDKGMDTGDILMQKKLDISPSDDAAALFQKMAALGSEMLKEAVLACLENKAPHIKQSGTPSYAHIISSKDALFSFSESASSIYNKMRALSCGPCARFIFSNPSKKPPRFVHLLSALPSDINSPINAPCGYIIKVEKGGGFYVKCGKGALYIKTLRPSGQNSMRGCDFLNGARLKAKDIISSDIISPEIK